MVVNDMVTLWLTVLPAFSRGFIRGSGAALALTVLGLTQQSLASASPSQQEETIKTAAPDQQNQPYSFTAEELWQGIKQVIHMSGDDLTKEKVEQIFNIKLQESTENPLGLPPGYTSILRADEDFNYRFVLSVRTGITVFGFSFESTNHLNHSRPDSLCLETDMAKKDIEDMGWSLSKWHPPPPVPGSPRSPAPLLTPGKTSFIRVIQDGRSESLSFYVNDYLESNCINSFSVVLKNTIEE